MAILSPVAWQQNSGATNSATTMRLADSGAAKGHGSLTRLAGRGGIVRRGAGNNLQCLQNGGGAMNVNVEPGLCHVSGTEAFTQGGYWVVNDATLNVGPFTTAHASLTRIDTVYVKVNDSQYSGGSNNAQILIQDGTAGSGVAGDISAINNAFKLAEVTIGPGATSILTANINNNGRYFTSPGGITAMRGDEGSEPGVHNYDFSVFQNVLRWYDLTAGLWRPFGISKVASTSVVPNPQTDDLCWFTPNKGFQRYTGSAWEDWYPNVARAHLRQTGAQSALTSTWTPLNFGTEDKDTLNGHSTVSNTSRYTCQRAGSYEFDGGMTWFPHATGARELKWMKNGADINGTEIAHPANGAFDSALAARTLQIDLLVGDYVELAAWQNSTTTLSMGVTGIGQGTMSVKYLGP